MATEWVKRNAKPDNLTRNSLVHTFTVLSLKFQTQGMSTLELTAGWEVGTIICTDPSCLKHQFTHVV